MNIIVDLLLVCENIRNEPLGNIFNMNIVSAKLLGTSLNTYLGLITPVGYDYEI